MQELSQDQLENIIAQVDMAQENDVEREAVPSAPDPIFSRSRKLIIHSPSNFKIAIAMNKTQNLHIIENPTEVFVSSLNKMKHMAYAPIRINYDKGGKTVSTYGWFFVRGTSSVTSDGVPKIPLKKTFPRFLLDLLDDSNVPTNIGLQGGATFFAKEIAFPQFIRMNVIIKLLSKRKKGQIRVYNIIQTNKIVGGIFNSSTEIKGSKTLNVGDDGYREANAVLEESPVVAEQPSLSEAFERTKARISYLREDLTRVVDGASSIVFADPKTSTIFYLQGNARKLSFNPNDNHVENIDPRKSAAYKYNSVSHFKRIAAQIKDRPLSGNTKVVLDASMMEPENGYKTKVSTAVSVRGMEPLTVLD